MVVDADPTLSDPDAAELMLSAIGRTLGKNAGESLEDRTGVPPEELAAIFRRHFHSTPEHLLDRLRVRSAQHRLRRDRKVTNADLTRAVGCGVRQLDRAFRAETALSLAAYRALGPRRTFTLALGERFRHPEVLAYLGRDPESPTERVEGRRFIGALRLPLRGGGSRPAVLEIELHRQGARCRLRVPRRRATFAAIHTAHRYALRRLGLGADPVPFEEQVRHDPRLAPVVAAATGLTLPATGTPYDCLIWAIVGQQVNLAFAYRLRRRLIELAGEPVGDGLTAPPLPSEVATIAPSALTDRQFSKRKAEYVIGCSRAVADGDLPLDRLAHGSAVRAEETLMAVRGIGPWSAAYVMMRGLRFADCVPVGDAGLVRSLAEVFELPTRPGPEETRALMRPFAPHRSLATYHLWHRLAVGA